MSQTMRKTNNRKDKFLEVINSIKNKGEKVTTPSIAKLMKISQQWAGHLIKRYDLTTQLDSYNGRRILGFLYRYRSECPPIFTRKELYVASQYKGSFEAFKLILWRHKINYKRERTTSMK
jgi:hypothetical protein